MRRGFLWLSVALIAWVATAWAAGEDGISPPVMGSLGKKFGAKVEISGQVSPHPALSVGDPFVVESIDGRKLEQPIQIMVRSKTSVAPGVKYTLLGYESGEFIGAPSWLYGPNDPIPQTNFGFRSWFEVTEVVWPKKLP